MPAEIELIRHATLRIIYGDAIVLVDPMLADAAAYPPVPDSPFPRRNPIVPLHVATDDILDGLSFVLVTHTHRDHWDDAAVKTLPKTTRVRCQPQDEEKIRKDGFARAEAIQDKATEAGIEIFRTGGRHGTGEMAKKMGPVSGFVLKRAGLPTIYVAGDTLWCDEVRDAINRHRPDVIVLNSGAAQFNTGGPITMPTADVVAVVRAAPEARVVAVHMNAWNHCVLTRATLADELQKAQLAHRVNIPDDSERVSV
jgi:L-ascorbate metabolism protein UlaG (beta-lactamase superfamily)